MNMSIYYRSIRLPPQVYGCLRERTMNASSHCNKRRKARDILAHRLIIRMIFNAFQFGRRREVHGYRLRPPALRFLCDFEKNDGDDDEYINLTISEDKPLYTAAKKTER